jgi:cellulose synthase/poly-beta-1,6-N-acetylglucosamine synthase-like glycosyltransferase
MSDTLLADTTLFMAFIYLFPTLLVLVFLVWRLSRRQRPPRQSSSRFK